MNRPRRAGTRGFTLVELLLVVFIGGVIGAISLSAFVSGLGLLSRTDGDTRGQADATIAAERLANDLREARRVEAGSTASSLALWIDTNGDLVQAASETVTWSAVADAASPGSFLLRRTEGAGTPNQVASTLTSSAVFAYSTATVTQARVVTVTLRYDAFTDDAAQEKRLVFQVRLRNAA